MKFGPVPTSDAVGAILAHSIALPDGRLRKGVRLTEDHIGALQAAGLAEVIVATLGPDDLDENAAAAELAGALVPDPGAASIEVSDSFTGRVNLKSSITGLAMIDTEKVHALNRVDPMVTLATVPPYAPMRAGRMVGTVKIISYAVDRAAIKAACDVARDAIRVVPPVITTASLIVTRIDGGPSDDKGVQAVKGRLEALDVDLTQVLHTPHREEDIAKALQSAGGQIKLILTASATSDAHDVAPEAVRLSGGQITRFGMPVDPGNLLFLGDIGDTPVIGLPGCARSPALNGADWVLERVVCGIDVQSEDIAAMGVGGLLKEIPSRPQPRDKRR
ncbi:molybdopterin-binding protein [Pseudaestuariivita rosea]|uniref:molybdopterin-binding protein n=1 Tax=Pseudaestuariivita rosea TaxID=2763263 RepID=UPI001ABAF07D|nr:molybdopterin-binding protein [Pseudaestuariivita rosea]